MENAAKQKDVSKKIRRGKIGQTCQQLSVEQPSPKFVNNLLIDHILLTYILDHAIYLQKYFTISVLIRNPNTKTDH